MKKILLIANLVFVCSRLVAQTNDNHLLFNVGILYERGVEATMAYEHGSRYHNAWEYFGTYYIKYDEDPEAGHITKDSFWNNYKSWTLGVCYKPCVTRGRNHHGNFRLGLSMGSDTEEFIGIAHVGYEHTFALYHGWEFFLQVKADAVLHGEDLFRTGIVIGTKIPL